MSIEDEIRWLTANVQLELDLAHDEKMGYPIQKPIGFRSWTAWVREQGRASTC
jgi:hypothetical protein